MKRLLASLGLVFIYSTGCGDVTRADGNHGLLRVGASAPDFNARDAQGRPIRFTGTRGIRVVYFYPKDGTPGCTKEACAFRDSFTRYSDNHISVFGVSGDSEESHEHFRKQHALPFPLAADVSGSIAQSYGVATRIGMPARVTFIVDAEGKVKRVFEDVDPAVHADQILAATAR